MKSVFVGLDTDKNQKINLLGSMSNRHGLITGATGTGKTVTLQVLAESFSRLGIPVFASDVKGDLSGLAGNAVRNEKLDARIEKLGIDSYTPRACPVIFWDLFGKNGLPIRTSIENIGAQLLAHLLELNETQAGVLQVAFKVAEDQNLLLLDMKDLKSVLSMISDKRKEITQDYGSVSTSSIGAIQRRLLVLSESGGDKFFGEPALDIEHLMQTDFSGNGVIGLLDSKDLMLNPRIYSTFLLWMLSRLFEKLPEVGDQELPKLIFFFDESHLLFDNAPKALIERVEQIVRLIRSKGVGVYFVSQHPNDVSEVVLSQLGNRIQHALRGYTPKEKEAIKVAANSFRQNPDLDTQKAITELSVGEALVSFLDEKGAPSMVSKILVAAPESKIGPIEETEKQNRISKSPLRAVYEKTIDRESAYEILKERKEKEKELAVEREKLEPKKKGYQRQSPTEAFFKSILRSVGSSVGRKLVKSLLGR